MKKLIVLSIIFVLASCKNDSAKNTTKQESSQKELPFKLTPIQHATFVMEWNNEVIYVDPTGGADSFEGLPDATLVFITDIHGDHFNVETLSAIAQTFDVVAPKAVYEKMPENLQSKTKVISNGESFDFHGLNIDAIPMYNITEERKKFHEKGRGNGYVISRNAYSVYISGDTEDIPEMRNLKNIDLAFICMNLPYTMTPEAAADATLEFKPKKVIPYHYRGAKDGETYYYDIENFKQLVNEKDNTIEVEFLEWYPSK